LYFRSNPNQSVQGDFPLNQYVHIGFDQSVFVDRIPQTLKVAVIKPLLKKPTLDPGVLAHCRPTSNLPFMSKVLEKILAAQLCDNLHRNNLFEEFQSGFRAHQTTLVKVTNDLPFCF